jgi:septum site-determining protein MinC
MADASIEFTGSSFTLLVLHLKTTTLLDFRTDLTKKVAQAPDFFYLVPIVVDIERTDSSIDFQAIKSLVEEFKFTFVGFTGTVSKEQRTLMRKLGFSYVNTAKVDTPVKSAIADEATEIKVEEDEKPPQVELYTDKIHHGQIRSGQQIYAKGQNLVVIGSVSAGAEVIADGNIHVYGSLRGRAIAGATGHHHAQIYCQNLEAELVSINGHYWLSESLGEHWNSPAYIHLSDAELVSSKLI